MYVCMYACMYVSMYINCVYSLSYLLQCLYIYTGLSPTGSMGEAGGRELKGDVPVGVIRPFESSCKGDVKVLQACLSL